MGRSASVPCETLPDSELQLFCRGKKFALPPIDLEAKMETIIIADLASGLKSDPTLSSEKVRGLVQDCVSTLDNPLPSSFRAFRSLRKTLCFSRQARRKPSLLCPRLDFLLKEVAKPSTLSSNPHDQKT